MRLPLTLRLIYYGFRSAMVAFSLAMAGWVTLVPATAAERDALRAPIGADRPDGLTQLRIARAMVHFAPERSARLLSRSSNGELSPELAGMVLRDIAAGAPDIPADPPPDQQTGGAKFIRVE
ncbi:hypothetical protein [Yoonia sp.]|uniref:hypothetical protein n=1 Tax=Yoonia sp. TaxID=2212373 RepID=UPI003F6AA35E